MNNKIKINNRDNKVKIDIQFKNILIYSFLEELCIRQINRIINQTI